MPLIPSTRIHALTFNLDDARGRTHYEEILNNPAMKLLSKRFASQSETSSSPDGGETTLTQQYVYVEVEECVL